MWYRLTASVSTWYPSLVTLCLSRDGHSGRLQYVAFFQYLSSKLDSDFLRFNIIPLPWILSELFSSRRPDCVWFGRRTNWHLGLVSWWLKSPTSLFVDLGVSVFLLLGKGTFIPWACGGEWRLARTAGLLFDLLSRRCDAGSSVSDLVMKGRSKSWADSSPAFSLCIVKMLPYKGVLSVRRTLGKFAFFLTSFICSSLLINTCDDLSISRRRTLRFLSSCCSSNVKRVWWTTFLFNADNSSVEAISLSSQSYTVPSVRPAVRSYHAKVFKPWTQHN